MTIVPIEGVFKSMLKLSADAVFHVLILTVVVLAVRITSGRAITIVQGGGETLLRSGRLVQCIYAYVIHMTGDVVSAAMDAGAVSVKVGQKIELRLDGRSLRGPLGCM